MSEPARLALIHAEAVEESWDEAAFAALLSRPGAICEAEERGFALLSVAADEAELLMLATRPAARRRGVAGRLLGAGLARAAAAGARRCFLEVAEDNAAAISLYLAHDYAMTGRRRGYYARAGHRVDALVMVKELGTRS